MTLRTCCAVAASMLLLACQPDSGSAAPSNALEPPAETGAVDHDIDQDVIVSTNEPFWQARIEGDSVVLSGADSPERRFTGARSAMTSDGRRVDASDAAGSIVLIVRRMGCEDDMSGARFPLTGLLTIDGKGPFRGCARPASMPRPAPLEAPVAATGATGVPDRFLGRWDVDSDACRTRTGDGRLSITADVMHFHESAASVVATEAAGNEAVRVSLRFQGEGDAWTETRVLRLDAVGTLVVEDETGSSLQRVRCEA